MPMPAPTLESGGSSEMPPTPVSYTFSLSSLCWPNFSWVGPFTVSSPLSFSLRVSYIKLQSTHKFTFNQHFSDLQSPTVPNTELVSVLAGNPNHTNREISACMSSFLDLWFGCLISRFILSHCICCRQRHQFKYDHIFQSYISILGQLAQRAFWHSQQESALAGSMMSTSICYKFWVSRPIAWDLFRLTSVIRIWAVAHQN